MKKAVGLVVVVLCVLSLAASTHAAFSFSWSTPPATGFLQDEFGTALTGSDDPSVGGFIQLVFDGGNDGLVALDGSQDDGIPASGNDIVVATAYIGKGAIAPIAIYLDGNFSSTDDIEGVGGYAPGESHTFYMRVFDTPSPNFGAGNVPTTGNYVDIGSFSLSFDDVTNGNATWEIGTAYQTTTPVPEPGALTLFVLGGMALTRFSRRKRQGLSALEV